MGSFESDRKGAAAEVVLVESSRREQTEQRQDVQVQDKRAVSSDRQTVEMGGGETKTRRQKDKEGGNLDGKGSGAAPR